MPNAPAAPAVEVPQRMLVLRDLCIRARGASCERCAAACPAGAITFGEGGAPAVDDAACTRCGICLGACDAFTSPNVTLTGLHAAIRRAALGGGAAVVACEEHLARTFASSGGAPAGNVVAVPCLAAVPPELWALALAEGTDLAIAADLALCEECPRAGAAAEGAYTRAVEQAEAWTGRAVGFAEEVPAAPAEQGLFAGLGDATRRGALEGLAGQLADVASGRYRLRTSPALQQFHEQRERDEMRRRLAIDDGTQFNRFARGGRTRKAMHPKRRMLLEAIEHDPAVAARVPVVLARVDAERCEGSLACTRACPTGALLPSARDGSLAFDARFCIGCGLCAPACPHGAIRMEQATAEALQW